MTTKFAFNAFTKAGLKIENAKDGKGWVVTGDRDGAKAYFWDQLGEAIILPYWQGQIAYGKRTVKAIVAHLTKGNE